MAANNSPIGRSTSTVSVTDPEVMSTFIGYISYTVSSQIFDETFVVKRRYTDFCWLKASLSEAFPGSIFPLLPKKDVMVRLPSSRSSVLFVL